MIKSQRILAAVAALAITSTTAEVASAACTRLAYSVNDYGKVGPTEDAKRLLDPYIKKWANERGIKTYRTGPKEVTCELFLDLIVFDEYTCKAAATVCWDGPLPKNHEVEAGAPTPGANKAAQSRPAAAPKAADAPAPAAGAPIATGTVRPTPAAAPAPKAVAPVTVPAAVPAAAPAAAPPAPTAPSAPPAN